MIIVVTPTKARLLGYETRLDELKKHLTYHDKKIDNEIQRIKSNPYIDPDEKAETLAELKKERFKNLLFEDEKGIWTYSGLAPWLASKFQDTVSKTFEYPESASIPWVKEPSRSPRPYQLKMEELLLEAKHAAVEVGTGLGKSFVIMRLAKRLGLKTVIMAPSTSIAEQLYKDFLKHLGKKYVGMVGDGKKEYKKLFVIGISASLKNFEEGDEGWEYLSQAQVFMADESHLCPAKTLAKVCFGLLANAPYRFFFSGTQMRGDGLDMVLEGITNQIVFKMTVKEGVDQGYLAKPCFKMINLRSPSGFWSKDPNKMTRKHLFYNPYVTQVAGRLANEMVEDGRPVLVLVDEFEQFTKLIPYLKHQFKFAHGGVLKSNKDKIPEEYWDSDPNALVESFNAKEFPILIGTSCVSTGTDIQACQAIIFLRGGRSEIEVKQSVGRGTRLFEDKQDCYFFDFNVHNVEVTARHSEARKEIYLDIYPDYSEMDLS